MKEEFHTSHIHLKNVPRCLFTLINIIKRAKTSCEKENNKIWKRGKKRKA